MSVRGRASRPQGKEPRQARRQTGGSPRFSATPDGTQTPGEHRRPRYSGVSQVDSTRLRADLTAWPVVLYSYRRATPGGCSRDLRKILGVARRNLPRPGLERKELVDTGSLG